MDANEPIPGQQAVHHQEMLERSYEVRWTF
jgi:hypothetical protein